MKTDRELLELAARAAGYMHLKEWSECISDYDSQGYGMPALHASGSGGQCQSFNSLIDDGDALRLAVKLRLSIIQEEELVLGEYLQTVEVISEEREDGSRICTMQSLDDDPMAATRRAITRAAAQIQEEKEKAK